MKVIFLGTPDFAVPALKKIVESGHEVLAVVSQPDKPSNRGQQKNECPVKKAAKEMGLLCLQYNKIRVEGVEDLKHLNPDIMVTCAFGQILSQEVIDIPKYGILNIHASLLPKLRGSAPINWAIVNGDTKSGVTIMRTDAGIDTGDMLIKREVEIGDDDTAGDLFDKLSVVGADLIVEALSLIESGNAVFEPQDNSLMTHCKMISKEDGRIDFSKSAKEIKNLVRGFNPWPIAHFTMAENVIKVFKVSIVDDAFEGKPGEVVLQDKKHIYVKCGEGVISIDELQFPNSRRMDVKDFLNGRKIEVGTILG